MAETKLIEQRDECNQIENQNQTPRFLFPCPDLSDLDARKLKCAEISAKLEFLASAIGEMEIRLEIYDHETVFFALSKMLSDIAKEIYPEGGSKD